MTKRLGDLPVVLDTGTIVGSKFGFTLNCGKGAKAVLKKTGFFMTPPKDFDGDMTFKVTVGRRESAEGKGLKFTPVKEFQYEAKATELVDDKFTYSFSEGITLPEDAVLTVEILQFPKGQMFWYKCDLINNADENKWAWFYSNNYKLWVQCPLLVPFFFECQVTE